MTALAALSDALDRAATRERDRLNELADMRVRIADLERRHEHDTQLIAQQHRLIEELGNRPAREVTA